MRGTDNLPCNIFLPRAKAADQSRLHPTSLSPCGILIGTFGLRSAEWHFTATRCLTTPAVVPALSGHWAALSALKAQSWKMWIDSGSLSLSLCDRYYAHKKVCFIRVSLTQTTWTPEWPYAMCVGIWWRSAPALWLWLKENNTKQVVLSNQDLAWPQHWLIFVWAASAGKWQQWAVRRPKVPANAAVE